MKKHNRIMLTLMLLLSMVLIMPASVFAKGLEEFDKDSKCTLGILLENEEVKGMPIVDTQVTVYRVADVNIEDGTAEYSCVPDFKGYAETITDIDSEEIADELFTYAVNYRLKGISKYTDSSGRTEFTDLAPGIYLVSQIEVGDGKYAKFKPFLAALPYDNKGTWVFNVLAKPKVNSSTDVKTVDVSVKKVWNDDGNGRPESIRVRLMCDGEEYETVVLDESSGWYHKWEKMSPDNHWSVEEVEVPVGYVATYRNDGLDFIVCNSRTLIQTGQLRWPIPVLAAGGLVFIISGILLKSKTSKNDE